MLDFWPFFVKFWCIFVVFWANQCDTDCPAMACIAVYCSRELFPIPVTYVYIIYGLTNLDHSNVARSYRAATAPLDLEALS